MIRFEKYSVLCVVAVIISSVWQYIWYLPISLVSTVASEYDFIIVGGGTAGSVLASRLSEDPTVTVLLVEAGDLFGYASKVPILPTIMQRGSYDWSFSTVPQKYSSFGLHNKIQFLPRGKGLGGSGQINYLLHGLGLPEDFDMWNKMGAKGWEYKNMETFINKTFVSSEDSSNIKSKMDHVIRLSNIDQNLEDINVAFMKSSVELSKEIKMDVHPLKYTIYNGQRESSLISHLLHNLNRKNLHVLINSLVTKIHFNKKEAESIEMYRNDVFFTVRARKEIILCAGSIKTPQLLILSGIGPKNDLLNLKIDEVSQSEGVGKNLHDHLNMPLYISINKPITMTLAKISTLKSLFSYLLKGQGYLASPGVVALGRGEDHSAIILFAMGSVDEVVLREIANFKPEIFRSFFPFYKHPDQEGFIFLNTCFQPSSRGSILLKNDDPKQEPMIDPNYLSNHNDIKCIIKAIRLSMDVLKTKTFQDLGAVLHWPQLDDCMHLWTEDISDTFLECIIRFGALTGHHIAGTCTMAGRTPVVDPSLMVRGVQKLSIVDASILPTPVSSPPNSVIVVIAERAAKIIRERHNIQPSCKEKAQ